MAGGAAATNVPARPIHVKSAGDAAQFVLKYNKQ